MSTRPSVISALGIMGAVLLLAGIVALTIARGPTMFSPGPLNGKAASKHLGGVASHAELAGECDACHPAPWSAETMDDRCLACHEAIGADVAAGEGLHGRLAAGPDPPRCRACHPEHGGASAALTLVDEATFPHELTGFALHGSHAGVACDACHPRDGYQMDEARPRDCVTCHEDDDEHRGALGRRCEQCHSTGGWADVTFDHAGFPLDHGSEERTAGCDTCHPSGLRRYSCLGCHEHTRANLADEHDGRSVEELAACVSCHPGGRKADD